MNGFTLIEILVAVSIMAVGIVGIYALVPRVVSVTSANQDKFIASQLAREGLEIVRGIRDSNWLKGQDWDTGLAGLTDCSGGCKADYNDDALDSDNPDLPLKIDGDGFYNYDAGDDTKFKRKIIIDDSTPNQLNVTVQVSWDGEGSPFEVEENLYNWR